MARNRSHRDSSHAKRVQSAQISEKVGSRFDQVAGRREIEIGFCGTAGESAGEIERGFVGADISSVQPKFRSWRIVRFELAGRAELFTSARDRRIV